MRGFRESRESLTSIERTKSMVGKDEDRRQARRETRKPVLPGTRARPRGRLEGYPSEETRMELAVLSRVTLM